MASFHWHVDSLVFRSNAVFGFGWVFAEDIEVATLSLKMSFPDGCYAIRAEHGKARSDVKRAYRRSCLALHSGFVVYGGCSSEFVDSVRVSLVGTLANGEVFELQIPPDHLWNLDRQTAGPKSKKLLQQTSVLLKRGLSLVRQGDFSNLLNKARHHLTQRSRVADGTVKAIVSRVAAGAPESVTLLIDHDLGGGANQYRHRLVAEKIRQGATVLLLSYNVHTLSHVLSLYTRTTKVRYTISGLPFIVEVAMEMPFHDVIYNTAVSFVRPEEIPQLIAKLKHMGHPRLTVLVHDYFMVCPSHFLLNYQGTYCNLPEQKECQACLDVNQQGFATLFAARKMVEWRALWGRALTLADDIITFSHSSRTLLSRAYPNLDLSHASVAPHSMEQTPLHAIKPSYVASLRIGVVGHVAYHKGAAIVQGLSREILRRKADIEIVVFGTLDATCATSVVRVTGPYRRSQLPAMICETGANTFLFPSICPETFSYVVQELMGFNLPVACFDLGAPPERLSRYSKGLVLNSKGAASVLDALIALHRQVYLSKQDPA